MLKELAFIQLRPAKTEETNPDGQIGLLSAFISLGKRSLWQRLLRQSSVELSFEMVSYEQKTSFYLGVPQTLESYFNSQVVSHYPKVLTDNSPDPLANMLSSQSRALAQLSEVTSFYYPLRTFKSAEDDLSPLAAILGYLGKLNPGEMAAFQMVVRVPNQGSLERRVRSAMKVKNSEGVEESSPYSGLFQEKLKSPFLEVQVRLMTGSQDQFLAMELLRAMAGSYGVYTRAEANGFTHKIVNGFFASGMEKAIRERSFYFWQPTLRLNLEEAASLWHLPGESMQHIRGIHWGKTILFEPPDNLPVAELMQTDEEKRDVNFFGQTEWRNHEAIFGIKREDRRKHVYTIGKTGAGKSTLIANMAINDIRNGEGVAVIDPHGDLSQMILDYIPKRRVPDVIYLDPSLSQERSFSLNLFDSAGAEYTDVVASGIVSVFYKLYHYSWGPRLEYILRNTILSLLLYGEATFSDIPRLLTDVSFRREVVATVAETDEVLTSFWNNEFDQMNDRLRTEAISPVLNKVGQFLSSHLIRNIVGQRQSTFSFEEVMNEGKILILNLSQGKLGEDTTALLGAMFITKMQLTAMQRVHIPEEQRRDFYLYVDEFQNFATSSFIKILSEARKYRLNLTLANQYIDQVQEDIQKAIFGNIGTLLTFVVGARDATLFEKEFGGNFTADDLVSLGTFEVLLKMMIDGRLSSPFLAKTLPLPSVMNDNRDKIIRVCLERYYKKV